MKQRIRIIIAAVVALLLLTPAAFARKSDNGGQAKLKMAETTYDFGLIDENGGAVSHEFEFINNGNGNLVIYDVTTQCGCTRPEFPKNPVAPGKKGKIKVTFLPQGRPGSLNKKITVYTNGKPAKTSLRITGRVAPKVKGK